ncbi:MAG: glycosyltransferase family 39 protein [Thaumarchaeota archaeon]|nr:glycosyltransferase family 39 protein [Nitrososphaerota archaeon]
MESKSERVLVLFRVVRMLLLAVGLDLALLLGVIIYHAAVPSPGLLAPVAFLAISLGLISASALILGTAYSFLRHPSLRVPILFISLLTIFTLTAHLYIINTPSTSDCYSSSKNSYGCIMDEVYYVPSAQAIVNGTRCAPFAPNCNVEHPFLGKAFIAAGIAAFGNNTFGWRIFQALLGSFSIPLLFLLAMKLSGSKRLAYSAALLLAFDVMFFSHSSAALIDVQMVFFALLAFVLYFYGTRVRRFDRNVLPGIFLGLALLSKETAAFLALTLVTYNLVFGSGNRRRRVLTSSVMISVAFVVFAGGLQVYDTLTTSIPTFVQHIQFILSYGGSLLCKPFYANDPSCGAWTDVAFHNYITPLNWLTYYTPVTYYGTSVSVCPNAVNGTCLSGQYSYVAIGYYGITNLLVTWMLYLWVPIAAYLVGREFRLFTKGQPSLDSFGFKDFAGVPRSAQVNVAGFALIWLLWNFLPYVSLYAVGRVSYPFYVVPAIPALALGAAYLITRPWFPRKIAIIYLAAAFVFFFVYFPYKGFLPEWLRALIGK